MTVVKRPPEVQYKEKDDFYGNARIDVGGAAPNGSKDDPVPKPKEMVPHCYHSMSPEFYEDLIHSDCPKPSSI